MTKYQCKKFAESDTLHALSVKGISVASALVAVLAALAVYLLTSNVLAAALSLGAAGSIAMLWWWNKRLTVERFENKLREMLRFWTHAFDSGSMLSEIPEDVRRLKEFSELMEKMDSVKERLHILDTEERKTGSFSQTAEITAGLAHELGTPLNIIRVNAQYLLRMLKNHEPERKHLDMIVSQTERIAQLIRNLLDFAREEVGISGEFDLRQIVESSVKRLAVDYPMIEWLMEMEIEEAPLRGWARRMDHAISNIILNACQVMNGVGSIGIRLHTIDSRGQKKIRLLISDTGTGMERKVSEKIFQPFYTTKPSGEGTGIGLALADRVIRQHGGTIHVSSKPEQGALFDIRLAFSEDTSDTTDQHERKRDA